MNKAAFAKLFGWLGGALLVLGQTNSFGKYSNFAGVGGALLTSLGVHNASATDGSK